ncbi:MAG: outer membrane protein assembly factor BamC [Piscirickettsiaceae bacterium]|nr:outer membrane protein assembly factor BamC [Piscirickettsiaceae bacterium]
MNLKHFKVTSLAVLLATAIAGCGALPAIDDVVPDNTKEYRRAETMPPLDVPPDLSTSRINDDIANTQRSSATYSEFEEAATNPLASKYNITPETKPALIGEGKKRHLMVPSEREVTWQNVLDFWQQKGVALKRQDIRIGMMDTEVGSDDYAYRVRIERGDTLKRSKVFVSGASFEVVSQKDEAMLRQLADFLGGLHQEVQKQAKIEQQSQPHIAVINATLIDETGGHQSLQVEQDFTDVWKRVGRILDSKGFSVEDRDRSRGSYFVRYIDPFNEAKEDDKGILDSLAFWRDDEDISPEEFYYIKLISDAEETKIIILDTEEVRISTDTAKRLLSLMQEQLAQ